MCAAAASRSHARAVRCGSPAPRGDPTYESACFTDHLRLRHRFDYGTFADYNAADEEEVLRRVLEASMQDV